MTPHDGNPSAAAEKLGPAPRRIGSSSWFRAAVVATVVVIALPLGLLLRDESGDNRSDAPSPFVDSATCISCHVEAYEAWRQSHHALAMQPATEATILANFNEVQVQDASGPVRFRRRGSHFIIEAPGPGGVVRDFRVRYTFGIDPLQQYLVELPNGRLQCLTWAWDTQENQWFSLYPDQNIDANDALHWSGRYQNWNSMCAECHSTELRRNYDPDRDRYQTTWHEINVGCQSCHGPGHAHVTWAHNRLEDGSYEAGDLEVGGGRSAANGLVVDFAQLSPHDSVDQCARCHSRRRRVSPEDAHGRPFLDDFFPEFLLPGLYFPDGQILEEVYVYGSFLQSKMYGAGVKCQDCHDPHSLKLRHEGNELCTRCHQSSAPDPRFPTLQSANYDSPEHHFHTPGSSGALCVNCHMPSRTYMQVDDRRDHSFVIPRPDLSRDIGVPNACTGCHSDKDNAWAIAELSQRNKLSDHPRARSARLFHRANNGDPEVVAELLAWLQEDTTAPLRRATALELLTVYAPLESDLPMRLAKDESPLIRTAAVRLLYHSLLRSEPAPHWVDPLVELLDDEVRSVRLEAARSLAPLKDTQLTERVLQRRQSLLAELETLWREQADLPGPLLEYGQMLEDLGRFEEALLAYERALRLDPRFLPARLQGAALASALGDSGRAGDLLTKGVALAPEEGELHYALALLYAEQERMQESLLALDKAARLLPRVARVHYNRGLALQHLDRLDEAEQALMSAYYLSPADTEILSALVIYHMQRQAWDRADHYVRELQRWHPNAPELQQLLETIAEAKNG